MTPTLPSRANEFVVRWQRVGLSARQRVVQTEAAAQRWVLRLQGRMQEATGIDPESFVCCDGSYGCGCGGRMWEQEWQARAERLPALVRCRIERRPVGEWELVEELQPAPFPLRPTLTAGGTLVMLEGAPGEYVEHHALPVAAAGPVWADPPDEDDIPF